MHIKRLAAKQYQPYMIHLLFEINILSSTFADMLKFM